MTADGDPILERPMSGCMAGFFHLFDRNYVLPPKTYVSHKRLLPIPDNESISGSEMSDFSTSFTEQSLKMESLANRKMAGLEGKEKPWKILELSRLSLDSRAVTDNKGKLQHRSPGAVARLMGLDALPDPDPEPKPVMLRRSVSESRVRNDPSFYRFVDASSFEKNIMFEHKQKRKSDNSFIQRKSFESFPEPRRTKSGTNTGTRAVPVSLYCEIERRLRVRGGMEEPTKDLETLKQVLEAVQLRGLMHSSKPSDRYDRRTNAQKSSPASPVVLIKPKPVVTRQPTRELRADKRVPRAARYNNESRSPRIIKNDEGKRGKLPSVKSPLGSPKKVGQGLTDGVKSGRRRNGDTVVRLAQREKCTGTGSDVRTKSSDLYHLEGEDRNGGYILERCDKLLSSIAAITSSDVNTGEDLQPSPVSVLDSSYLEEGRSPFPHSKRTLHFHEPLDRDLQETRTIGFQSDDPDYPYVAEIVRASNRSRDLSELQATSPKLNRSGFDTSLHTRLLFDVVNEILHQHNNMSTRDAFLHAKSFSNSQKSVVQTVWQEIQKLREPIIADDLNDFTFSAICKDMSLDRAWIRHSFELSDVAFQIERLIFKDLLADTILGNM